MAASGRYRGEFTGKEYKETFWDDGNGLYFKKGFAAPVSSVLARAHQMIHLRSLHFIVCILNTKDTTNSKLVNDGHDDVLGEKCTEICNLL